MKKLICILFGHDDPVLDGAGIVDQDELYEHWKSSIRNCRRCDRSIKVD